jgi:hypothetical protein
MFTIDEVGVSIVVGLVLPLALGILIKPTNPPWVKVIGGVVVAAIAALVKENIQDDGTAVISWPMVVETALIYVPQIAAYLGIWKPLANDDLNGKMGPGVIPIEH